MARKGLSGSEHGKGGAVNINALPEGHTGSEAELFEVAVS